MFEGVLKTGIDTKFKPMDVSVIGLKRFPSDARFVPFEMNVLLIDRSGP